MSPRPRITVSLVVGAARPEARVFHGQLAEDVEDRRCSSPFFRLDGEAGHRQREFQRLQVDVVLVVRIVQHAVELDFLDLGDRTDLAGTSSLTSIVSAPAGDRGAPP